jgi:cation transport ATPase
MRFLAGASYMNSSRCSGQAVIIEASDESAVIEGITLDHGLLRTRVTAGPNAGRVVDLQPDGNSFDM